MRSWLIMLALGGCWTSAGSGPPAATPPPTRLPPLARGHLCAVRDRIIVVGEQEIFVYSRDHALRARGPITRREHLDSRCDGPGGGHAGCSITFDRFWSPAVPHAYVELGTNQGNVLIDERDPNGGEPCADR
jgi:hypothetical protein